MNLRSSLQKRRVTLRGTSKMLTLGLMAGLIATGSPMAIVSVIHADRYDEQIQSLQGENREAASSRSDLQTRAETLSQEIANIRQNIRSLESQIQKSQNQHAAIEQKIAELENEIVVHRDTLGKNVRQMYLDDQMSTIEKLASSKNLSDYVDKEQYRVSIQSKIQETMAVISDLKDEQEAKKTAIEKLIEDRKLMQDDLAAERKESQRLLALNKKQQREYASEMQENNARIAQLRREQAAENARHFVSTPTTSSSAPVRSSGSGDTYPWPNVPFPNTIVDPWGMYKRQCVSYTAWKVHNSGRHMPYWGGRGNAKLWANNARAAGIPVSNSPRVGDVAVSTAGTYGHVMYVEAVHGDGTISISDYNAGWDGRYREGRRTTHGLQFIHFR